MKEGEGSGEPVTRVDGDWTTLESPLHCSLNTCFTKHLSLDLCHIVPPALRHRQVVCIRTPSRASLHLNVDDDSCVTPAACHVTLFPLRRY